MRMADAAFTKDGEYIEWLVEVRSDFANRYAAEFWVRQEAGERNDGLIFLFGEFRTSVSGWLRKKVTHTAKIYLAESTHCHYFMDKYMSVKRYEPDWMRRMRVNGQWWREN